MVGRSRSITLVLLGIVSWAASASGQLMVDDFTVVQSVSNPSTVTTVTDEIAAAGVLGGVRLIRLTNGAMAGTSSGMVSGGALTLATDTESDLEIWWDGVDDDGFTPSGLGGVDLTQGGMYDKFVLDVTANSRPTDAMRLFVWIDGANRCYAEFPMPVGTVEIPFSSLTNCSGTATAATSTTNAGLVQLRTVFRPGAWTFTLGFVESTPVELLDFSVD